MIATAAMAAVNEILRLWAARDGRLDADAMLDRALDELATAFAPSRAAARSGEAADVVVVLARGDATRAELVRQVTAALDRQRAPAPAARRARRD